MKNELRYDVREYDSQRDGTVMVAGWEVRAQVTFKSGRKSPSVVVALCPDKDDAEEIATLLTAKYAEPEDDS